MHTIIRSDIRQVKSKILIDALSATSGHTLYMGVNGTAPWADEYNPPTPKDTANEIKKFWDHSIIFHRITQSQTWSAIPRNKWLPNKTFELRNPVVNSDLQNRFYCVNSEFEVYQCVNIVMETEDEFPRTRKEPKGHNNGMNIETGDGYTWKFMYQVKPEEIETKINEKWIPVYIDDDVIPESQTEYGIKHLDHILNARCVACRMNLTNDAKITAASYRQYGLFVDLRNKGDLKVATKETLLPSEVLKYSGYLVYIENVKKTDFESDKTEQIDIVIEC